MLSLLNVISTITGLLFLGIGLLFVCKRIFVSAVVSFLIGSGILLMTFSREYMLSIPAVIIYVIMFCLAILVDAIFGRKKK